MMFDPPEGAIFLQANMRSGEMFLSWTVRCAWMKDDPDDCEWEEVFEDEQDSNKVREKIKALGWEEIDPDGWVCPKHQTWRRKE